MREIRYIFPDYIEIIPLSGESLHGDNFEKDTIISNESKSFVLIDKIWRRTYIVNYVIKMFLEIFRTPCTESQATQQLALQAKCLGEQIKPTVSKFLKQMFRQRILLNADNEHYRDRQGMLKIGQTFFQYTIIKLISVRPNVELYLAKCNQTEEHVVLKILTPFYQDMARHKMRLQKAFEREFTLMQSLPPHKNICQCLVFCKGEPTYAVLEFVDGHSLRHHIMQAAFSIHERLRICMEALSTVAHLHKHDILHGDIQSQNFLLNNNMQVKLIDFGLAYYESQLRNGARLSHGGIPYFMPPERITCDSLSISKHPGDKRSEVYQMGVLLYEILAGKLPFRDALTWRVLASSILNSEPTPLVKTPEGHTIPEHYANIVQRALIKTPIDRFSSVSEMVEEWNKLTLLDGK
jgi:serine/threonine protein kinase